MAVKRVIVAVLMLSSCCLLGKPVAAITDNGDVTQVTGIAGNSVDLPCDIQPRDPGDHAVLVLWYKDYQSTPLYSFDARGRETLLVQKGLGAASGGALARATFVRSPGPALRLNPLQGDDHALYRCRVDFQLGPTRNLRVNLTVIVPPSPPVILHNNRPIVGTVGPLPEGQPVELTCVSQDGRPMAELRWFRKHDLLDDSFTVERRGVTGAAERVVNSLTLPPLTRADLHSEVTCQAVNNPTSRPGRSRVRLLMHFGPRVTQLMGSSRTSMMAGSTYPVVCSTSGSHPPANITWLLNGRVLERAKQTITDSGETTRSTLEFSPGVDDDGELLICRSSNGFIKQGTMEDSRKLNVRYAPVVSAKLGYALDPGDIREGTDAYFDCTIRANPSIYSVSWMFNGLRLEPTSRSRSSDMVSFSSSSLVIRNLTRHSTGAYSCQASNPEGEGVSSSVNLTVKHAPVCADGQQVRYGAALNEPTQVTCQVTAQPDYVRFRWQFNTTAEQLDMPSSQMKSTGLRSVVTHVPKNKLDYGTLLCWAQNSIGRMSKPCVFQIVLAGPPDSVKDCGIFNQTSTSLQVECAAGFDGGLRQRFVAELSDPRSGRLLRNVTRPAPLFAFADLSAGVPLRVSLYAVNTRGHSRPTTLSGFRLKLAEKRVGDDHAEVSFSSEFPMTPLYGVLIGVVSSLLLIAIGVVVCLRHSSERKRTVRTDLTPSSEVNKTSSIRGCEVPAAVACQQAVFKHHDPDDANPDVVPNSSDPNFQVVATASVLNHVNGDFRRNVQFSPRPEVTVVRDSTSYSDVAPMHRLYASLENYDADGCAGGTRSKRRTLETPNLRDTVVRAALLSNGQESVV